MHRKQADEDYGKKRSSRPVQISTGTKHPPEAPAEEEFTEEDFEEALRKVSRKDKPKDDKK